MRRQLPYAVLALCIFACVAFGQVKLPEVAPAPVATPSPAPVTKLPANTLYVVEGSAMVLASPPELVEVVSLASPVSVYGVFADAKVAGKPELRSFAKPVHLVTAAGTGRVELLVVPAGVTDPAKVVRRVIDVDAGQGPQPPPEPKPPGPKPPEPQPTDPLFTPIQAAYGADISPTKNSDRVKLAAVYRALAMPGKGIHDPAITTEGQLATVISTARALQVGDRLAAVREIVGNSWVHLFTGTPGTVVTVETKAKVADILNRAASVLEAIR